MADKVPGTAILQMSIDHAWRAQQAAREGRQADAISQLAVAVQQLAGGVKEALQAIYEEVD